MRNATIATSRTRATADARLIEYRPLPARWGDVATLHALRRARSGAAARRVDLRVLESRSIADPAARESGRRDGPGVPGVA